MNAVKIIKRKNRQETALIESPEKNAGKNGAASRRRDSATETVKNWIAEWREKKTIDARRAFADLFDRQTFGKSSGLPAAGGK